MGNLWKTGSLAVCLCLGLTGFASGAQGDQEAYITELIQKLTKGDRLTRAKAAGALAQVGPKAARAMPALLEALKNDYPYVRHQSVIAILHIRTDPEKAVPALVALLNDEEKVQEEPLTVCDVAISALGVYGASAKEAIPSLLRKLKSGGPSTRQAVCMTALGSIRADGKLVIPVLLDFLSQKDPGYLRAAAANSLGSFGPGANEAIPHLLRAFPCEDVEEEYRKSVIQTCILQTLGRLGAAVEPHVPRLIAHYTNQKEPRKIRIAALRALGELGPVAQEAVPALQGCRSDRAFQGEYEELDNVLAKIQAKSKVP